MKKTKIVCSLCIFLIGLILFKICKRNYVKNIESCYETVHVFSAVAQAKPTLSFIEHIVLNVLDGSKHSNCDCCIYGYQGTHVHRVNAVVKETYIHNSKLTDLIAKQFQCSVKNIGFRMVNIQLVGKMESCSTSYNLHPVLYPAIKENGFGICAKIAYNYLNPFHLIEWFEYQKMMGVDMVLISLQSLNKDAYKVLKYYEREGISKLISFPNDMPGKLDRGFTLQYWHYHQSSHDEQVAVYSCKEFLQGFAFVAIIDFDEIIVNDEFSEYTKTLLSEILPSYPDAAAFTLNVSFFITDWGVSGVEPLITSKYIRRTYPLAYRYKNIYLPNRTETIDTHRIWPKSGYRRISLQSHNVILHHYRDCNKLDMFPGDCTSFPKYTDTKMIKIMPKLYDRVVAAKKRCGRLGIPTIPTTRDEAMEEEDLPESSDISDEDMSDGDSSDPMHDGEDLKACQTCGLVFVYLRGFKEHIQKGCGINKSIEPPMSRKALEDVLNGVSVTVVCADDLPAYVVDRPKNNCDKKGSHWVVFHFSGSDTAEFFDSLGQPPEVYQRRFRNVLIANGPQYCYSPCLIQPSDSETCGLYCAYYVKKRCRGF